MPSSTLNIMSNLVNGCNIPSFSHISDMDAFSKRIGSVSQPSDNVLVSESTNNSGTLPIDNRVNSALKEIINIEEQSMLEAEERMNDESALYSNIGRKFSHNELIAAQRKLKDACTKEFGYIVWLEAKNGLPDFRSLTAKPISAISKEIVKASEEMSQAATQFLEDIPHRVTVDNDIYGQFTYSHNRITQSELSYYEGKILFDVHTYVHVYITYQLTFKLFLRNEFE